MGVMPLPRSIISNDRVCYVCGATYNLHRHHIFYGPNRKKSEKYGCWVYLCAKHHNMSDQGVHFNKALDNSLKRQAQERWQEKNGDKFVEVFGKNYL